MRKLKLTRPHQTGSDVRYAQRCLNRHGFSTEISGTFDEPTHVGVLNFQYIHNIPSDGVIDDNTWSLLTRRVKYQPQPSDKRYAAIRHAIGLLGKPYIYGSSNPDLGLDPLGFLQNVLYWSDVLKDVSNETLAQFLTRFKPTQTPIPGDLIFYTNPDKGYPTHVLIMLNDTNGIGPIGGNAHTTNAKLAMQRQACVKIVNFNYRRPAGYLNLNV